MMHQLPSCGSLGCSTMRRQGFRVFQPPEKRSLASASDRDGTMITGLPLVQLIGVATLWASVSCRLSITHRILLKLRPVLGG